MPSKPPEERPKLPTAKWGAACAACATAKAKCIRSNETPGSKCDRCERLLKECTDQVHRPRKKRQPKPSRTAQIEERLNGLVSLLQATGELPQNQQQQQQEQSQQQQQQQQEQHQHQQQQQQQQHIQHQQHQGHQQVHQQPQQHRNQTQSTPGSGEQYDYETPSQVTTSPTASSAVQKPKSWSIPPTYNSFGQQNCICRPESGDAPPPPDSDETALDIYRSQLQPLYPFVIIPSHAKASSLQSSRPFLMASIRMVTSFRSLRSMRAQMYNLKQHLADYMLIRSERSMDLLLGLVVILGWYQYHCFAHAQLHNLISLAISLVGEMGLNRHPIIHEGTRVMAAQPPVPNSRSNEERRVFMGVWFLASSMATVFGRIESMRYTSYVQECLRILEAGKEYDTDVNLVFLVRIQHLIQRISDLNPRDTTVEEFTSVPKAPAPVYVSSYKNELERLRDGLPDHLKNDKIIQIYFNTATLRLYEPPVVDKALISSLAESFTSSSAGAGTPLDRIYHTSAALTAWFDNWLSVPVSQYYCQTTAVASQLVYALTMLGRWAQLIAPKPADTSDGAPTQGLPSFEPKAQTRRGTAASQTGRPSFSKGMTVDSQAIQPCDVDPDLPAAVASLRKQLQTHPGLMVNISEILSTICNRFEQANATFQISSTDSGNTDNNVWSMTALKVRITRAKLERWAELVSKEGENHSPSQQLKADMDTSMGDWDVTSFPQQPGNMAGATWDGMNPNMPPDQMQMQNFYGSTPWRSDLLTGVDPTVWFDGYLDWGAVIMNSMGTVEQ